MVPKMYFIVLNIFAIMIMPKVEGQAFVRKFRVIHESILTCPKRGSEDIQINVQLFKKDQTHKSMRGNFTFKVPFNDNVAIRAQLWSWSNGGWKSGIGLDLSRDEGCSTLSLVLGPIFTSLSKEMHAPPKCPIKQGVYHMNDFDTANWDNMAIPGAPLSKFKLELTFLKRGTKKILGCYSSVFTTKKKTG